MIFEETEIKKKVRRPFSSSPLKDQSRGQKIRFMAHGNKELEIMFTNSPLLIVHGCSPDKWVLMVLKAWDEKYLQLMAVFVA